MEEKMAREAAEHDFKTFAEAWDIDDDVDGMVDEDDKESFRLQAGRIIRKIRKGQAVVDEGGAVLRYTLLEAQGSVEVLTFNIPKGQAWSSMDRYKDRQNIGKLNAFMADMTDQSPSLFAKMDGRDLKFCQAVTNLFLGS